MKRLPVLAALLSLSLASASTLTLQPGQTGSLGAQKVTLLRVQDSRCPVNARCVRAGELVARVLVTRGHRIRLLTLQLPAAMNSPWAGLGISWATPQETGRRTPLRVTFTDGRT